MFIDRVIVVACVDTSEINNLRGGGHNQRRHDQCLCRRQAQVAAAAVAAAAACAHFGLQHYSSSVVSCVQRRLPPTLAQCRLLSRARAQGRLPRNAVVRRLSRNVVCRSLTEMNAVTRATSSPPSQDNPMER
jgi:hypothetical protein